MRALAIRPGRHTGQCGRRLRHFFIPGDVAQLGEHRLCKAGVESSSLFVSIRESFRSTQLRNDFFVSPQTLVVKLPLDWRWAEWGIVSGYARIEGRSTSHLVGATVRSPLMGRPQTDAITPSRAAAKTVETAHNQSESVRWISHGQPSPTPDDKSSAAFRHRYGPPILGLDFDLRTPPHCLKKNGTFARWHCSRMRITRFSSIFEHPTLSPPTITQSIPLKSTSPKSSSSGSIDKNRNAADVCRSESTLGSPYFRSSTLTPHQMWPQLRHGTHFRR